MGETRAKASTVEVAVNRAIRRSYHARWCGPECPNGPSCEGYMEPEALRAVTYAVVEALDALEWNPSVAPS